MLSHLAEMALIAPIFAPLVISLILFTSANSKNKPKLFLALAMLNVAFVFLGNFLYFSQHLYIYSFLHGFHIFAVLAIYPSLYIYFLLLTQPTIAYKKIAIHFLPSLVFLSLSGALFFPFLSPKERIYFLSDYRLHPTFDTIWLKALWVIRYVNVIVIFGQICYYSYKIHKLQKKHNKIVANCFSSPWSVNVNWLKVLNTTLITAGLLCIFVYSVYPKNLFTDERYLTYPFGLLSIVITIIGLYGNNQQLIYNADEAIYAVCSTDEEQNNCMNECDSSNQYKTNIELKKRLEHYFESQKPYLNPDLKIWDVSTELGSNRTYISKLINEEYGVNFSQFVNQYRINHTKALTNNTHTNIEQVAVQAGFGSYATYRRTLIQLSKLEDCKHLQHPSSSSKTQKSPIKSP